MIGYRSKWVLLDIVGGALLVVGCSTSSPSVKNGYDQDKTAYESSKGLFDAEAAAIRSGSQPPDWQEVIQRMDGVIRANTNNSFAWYNLGVAQAKLKQWEAAATAYRRAYTLNSSLHEARENLVKVLFAKGDRREAYQLLAKIVKSNPSAVEARVALARYLLAEGRVNDARQLCVQALTYEPKHIEAYCVLSEVALVTKNYLRVRLLVAQGFKIQPDAACLHDALGQLAHAEGDDGAALAHYERAIVAGPRRGASHFRIGALSLAYRAYQRARAAFEAVVQLMPRRPEGYVNLGIALSALGESRAAEKTYLEALRMAGDTPLPAAHLNLGILYLRYLEEYDKAEKEFRIYLRQSDRDTQRVYAWISEARRGRVRAVAEEDDLSESRDDCLEGTSCGATSDTLSPTSSRPLSKAPDPQLPPSQSDQIQPKPNTSKAFSDIRQSRRSGESQVNTDLEPADPADVRSDFE